MGKNTTNDMTQGNCMRLLVQFFLPILAGNLFQQLYSFADSMVVGKGIGDTALAAVRNELFLLPVHQGSVPGK